MSYKSKIRKQRAAVHIYELAYDYHFAIEHNLIKEIIPKIHALMLKFVSYVEEGKPNLNSIKKEIKLLYSGYTSQLVTFFMRKHYKSEMISNLVNKPNVLLSLIRK